MNHLSLIIILGLPLLVTTGMFMLYFLPSEVLTFLTAWILVSFPIGVLIGHCVLNEESTAQPLG